MLVNDSISFKSRNYEILCADDLAREIAKRYPVLSSSKISRLPNSEIYFQQIDKLHSKIQRYKSEYSHIFPFERAKSQGSKFRKYSYKSHIETELDKCSKVDLIEIRKNGNGSIIKSYFLN